jgi:hypothetical protein
MEFRQTVQDSESGLERLMSHVPGYSGYKEKETRREADKLLREYLVGQLDVRRRRLAELQRQLLDGGGLLFMDDIERAVTKVQKLADMIRTATYGYAGLFDAVKVKESQLDALYSFDNQMLEQVTAIQTPIDALATAIDSNGDVNAAIKEVIKATEDANARWRQREDAITGAA